MTSKLTSFARWSVLAALLCLWQPCFAQYSAVVQGTVSDSKGAVVVGATVTLTNTATNISDAAITNHTGGYRFDNVQPSDYRITVAAAGFETAIADRHVSTDENAGVNVTLTVGGATVTVNVTAAEVGLNPDETRLEYTLTSTDIDNMPLPDRSSYRPGNARCARQRPACILQRLSPGSHSHHQH
jgi:hypothetical protein